MLSAALLAFAFIFLLVGIWRVVEFSGLGLAPTTRVILTIGHIIGTVLFSAAIALTALDAHQVQKERATVFFFSAIVILFPVHIFIAIKRKIKLGR